MSIIDQLRARTQDSTRPFLMTEGGGLCLDDVACNEETCAAVRAGDVVALIGDFDSQGIRSLLTLLNRRAIIMPLAENSAEQHEYFFEAGCVDVVLHAGRAVRRQPRQCAHPLLDGLRNTGRGGLILFTSGSTGRPKAILHDCTRFLARYTTPRPAWITLNFMLFDHIGGLNTLFHTMFNGGLVVRPSARSVEAVLADVRRFGVELLPATPTFLRMLALSGQLTPEAMPSLRLVTYGTERMDMNTLTLLAQSLPHVDIRQTYGMSELGILRVRTRSRDALWISVGGDGVETRVVQDELHIRTANRMEGYLNAPSPFDEEGWYNTRDQVECDGAWLRIIGRTDQLVNVGGLKVLPAEVELAALSFPGVLLAKAVGRPNPITGMHVELTCQMQENVTASKEDVLRHLRHHLPPYAMPLRLALHRVSVSHRFKVL